MKFNNLYKNTLSFILIVTILLSNLSISFSTSNTIYIDSLEDLIKFSENARLDSYYNNKTVVLNSNIDLSSIDSFSIPTFNGVFDGQGYTLSGLSILKSGSNQGLFRYLQEDGLIKNLNVSGKVTPSGSQNVIGGIVGNNRGRVENCSFTGDVKGKNNIGGIVGINEATGTISNCKSQGSVLGEHFTGGISGHNLGIILKSTNSSEVNTSLEDTTLNLDDIDWTQINSMENINAHTDTGGIAGLSSGYIQDSINRGPVGYKHMGYNVGGIVGRQSGYLSNCENYNTVLGRKDVGGIVGQIEPYLMLLFSEDTLQKLNKEVEVLENILTSSFNNFKSYSISEEIDAIIDSLDDTKDSMQVLSRETADHIDDVTDTINITNERIRYTLDEIVPILEKAEDFSEIFKTGLDHIELGFDNLEATSDNISHALNEGDFAINDLRHAIHSGEDAIYNLRIATKNLANNIGNNTITGQAFVDLENRLEELAKILDGLSDLDIVEQIQGLLKDLDINAFIHISIDELIAILESLGKDGNLEEENLGKFKEALISQLGEFIHILENDNLINHSRNELIGRLTDLINSLEDNQLNFDELIGKLIQTLKYLQKDGVLDEASVERLFEAFIGGLLDSGVLEDLPNPLISIADSISSLKKIVGGFSSVGDNLINITDDTRRDLDYVFDDLYDSSKKLDRSARSLSNTFSKLEDASDESSLAFDEFSKAFNKFSTSSESMTGLVASIRDLVDSLVDKPNIELPKISSEYRQSGENLFDNMGNITSNVNKMNREIRKTKDNLVDDFQGINDQVLNIFQLLVDSREDMRSSDYIEDISDENINENSLGTVYKNRNYGSIDGDINVGGIVGAMSIEYDLDPEDDILKKGTRSLNFKYLTTSILKNSINHGKISCKKDYSGGIVGRMDLGIIGLIPIDQGEIQLFEQPLNRVRKKIAYLPQRSDIDWSFPILVKDTVLLGTYPKLGLFKGPKTKDKEWAMECLEKVGMEEYGDKQISELSGGQQQRVFLARALAQEADCFFLDEPFVGIDVSSEELIINILRELRDEGKIVFVVHHDLTKVKSYFDDIILLNKKLIGAGPVDLIFKPEFMHAAYQAPLFMFNNLGGE